VQILLPKETGIGQPIGKDWFDGFLKELTEKFGGATSFLRAPGRGLWQRGSGTEKDSIAVVEVMAEEIDCAYWQSLRERLERSFPRRKSSSGPRKSDGCNGRRNGRVAILGTFAAVTTVLPASLVAANLNAGVTVAGFMIFIVASIAWMADGWLETKASLVIQNLILLLINAIGVWRWFPKAEKEAKS